MRPIKTVLISLFAALTLAACSPVGAVIGAGAVAGSTALQERGFEQALRDAETDVSIQAALADRDFETFKRIGVAVVEGRVLLTGVVPTAEDRILAVKTAWQDNGVVEVLNEIRLGDDAALEDTGFNVKMEKALDLALTLDRDVAAVNYTPVGSGGTLHILGIAQSQAELDRVIAHAREVERVRRIVSHVQLKDSPERAETLDRLAALQADAAS